MKIPDELKKHQSFFLVVLLVILCSLIINTIYIRKRVNNWYDSCIDKNQSGLRVFYYSYDGDWNLDFEESGIVKKLSFLDSRDKEFQREHFFIHAIGVFSVPETGRYKFYLKSDDGSALYINQKQIIDNGGIHPAIEKSKTIPLRKGPNLIVIEYFQALGDARLDFSWSRRGDVSQNNDLGLYFRPVFPDFQWDGDLKWDKNLIQLLELNREKRHLYFLHLLVFSLVFFIWFILKFLKKMLSLWEMICKTKIYPVLRFPVILTGRFIMNLWKGICILGIKIWSFRNCPVILFLKKYTPRIVVIRTPKGE